MGGFNGRHAAGYGRDHYGYNHYGNRRHGFGGYYDYDSCPYYTSYNWPYTCTY
jgi:hypothetical protein